jgi:hypothetical protein
MIVNNGLVTIPPQVSCSKTLQVVTHIYKITRGLVTIPPQVSCGKTLQVFTHIYIYINWFRSWHIYIYKLAWVLALTLSFALTPLTPSPIIS